MPRLAVCMVCNKLERMVDPPTDIPLVPATLEWDDHGTIRKHTIENEDGTAVMVPMYDPILEDFVGRHGHNMPDTDVIGAIKMFPVDQATYDKVDVVKELKKELQQMTGEFYEESMYYRDEAIKCFNTHGNPEAGCIDYCDDSKVIGPGGTSIAKKHRTYLCYMCPVQAGYVSVELRKRKGWYDPKNDKKLQAQKRKSLGNVKKV